ncbi:MAG: tetratricopeptide repeat protein [Magnetospirillum sp.]|nr:tetratricopeptide repeat protein [Magnetospirillum sp.]
MDMGEEMAIADTPDALARRGGELHRSGHPRDALMLLLQALGMEPRHAQARLELARVLTVLGRGAEARAL